MNKLRLIAEILKHRAVPPQAVMLEKSQKGWGNGSMVLRGNKEVLMFRSIEQLERISNEFLNAIRQNADMWVPACGGTEKPFIARSGAKLLYCYNPAKNTHAYLHCDVDIILSDQEAAQHLGLI